MRSIKLNINLCRSLRNKINQYQNYSIHNTHPIKKDIKDIDIKDSSWKKICAIMDRLDDTTEYLNTIDFDIPKDKLSIFQFYNFMNNATTLLDCISFLAKIFVFSTKDFDNKSDIFDKSGNPNSGTDKRYFKYLRSLCAVHPIETNHQEEFKDKYTYAECSPFVTWNETNLTDSDLLAVVYIDNPETSSKYIGIELDEIFAYVNFRFNILEKIIKHIDSYFHKIIETYKNTPLKNEDDFSDYCSYINYLKEIYAERVNTGWDETFKFYILVMQCSFSNSKNQEKLLRYQNIIKYSFSLLHNYLQTLPIENVNADIIDNEESESLTDDYLFFTLQYCEAGAYGLEHRYAFEKLSELYYERHYMDMAPRLINDIKDYWDPYVQFEADMDADEICILLHVASYFWQLDNNPDFEKLIPKDKNYR